jgi:hypothetical protein
MPKAPSMIPDMSYDGTLNEYRDERPIKGMNSEQTQAYNLEAQQAFSDTGRVECQNCARRFLPDRLAIHAKSCKPGGFFEKQAAKKAAGLKR